MPPRRRLLQASLLGLASPALMRHAAAQAAWPTRPVTIVVPFPPGGSNDLLARPIALKLQQALGGHPVVVENRGGAGGTVGATAVARATPDGHTLMWGHVGTLAVNPWIYPNIPYSPLRDFAPVALVATLPSILTIHPSVPVTNAAEFIAYAKANPGQLEYGSAGNGAASHITMAAFCDAAGIELVHVPYRGNGPMLADLIAGRLKASFAGAPVVLPSIRDGRLKGLGMSALRPSDALPGLAPIAGALPGFEVVQWHGLVAPAATPPEVVARINAAVNGLLGDADVKARLTLEGADAAPRSPEAFRQLIASEMERFRVLIGRAGIKAD
ncbi:Bug family tripartite tricarboxylate transporter substrate binding protein [Falsiroseomonas selenitidurans]|uniref:Tripartite tricarboxylate transporter substrate binding protein n=1 Tax=Falsiroseomonas selenitidurans TaxID=2716335 RepID=A0ABX1EBP3_9PROT|nr:tripartite tricarboxylate transporter substrate-binding protein [Falsiroseomonas selenitidurans]NKC34230.1 tripartite tricarboxylate transporter substrate binding protein [Falsiroseomonas selenitidurans]